MIRDILNEIDAVEQALARDDGPQRAYLTRRRADLLAGCKALTPEDRVFLARHTHRPKIDAYINALFTDFFEQKGDRQCREDPSILGGVALYKGQPVTVIGHRKGSDLQGNLKYNFGMPGPEGYRKALRLMKQAEKFGRPIITFIDTPGAYPGLEAEARGQGEAIARNLAEMSRLEVPVIAVVTGEGSSGGALALGIADEVWMMENSVYSILSPEGFASILWKDSSKAADAAEALRLTAQDLFDLGVIERIIRQPKAGDQAMFESLKMLIKRTFEKNLALDDEELLNARYERFRKIGIPE